MSDWLVRRRYGFGGARIPLCADPHISWGEAWTLREAAALARPHLGLGRSGLSLLPAIGMGLVIAAAPLLALLQRDLDLSDIDIVMLQTPVPDDVPVPLPATPPARPRVVEPPPPEVPPTPKRVSKPPPVAVAVAQPPPAEAPRAQPRPAPPRAAPEPPRVVVSALVAPEPLREPAPAPIPATTRMARMPAVPPAAPAFVPAVAIDAAPATQRSPRTPGVRRREPVARSSRPAAPPVASFAATPTPPDADAPRPTRRRGALRPPPGSGRSERNERPGALSVPTAPARSTKTTVAAAASPPERRRPAVETAAAAGQARPGLAGVPLASLASCVSDREEDLLKQRVLSAVGGRSECRSTAGRYVFVETRNLNAFLMYVERPSTRSGADRCTELTFALDCLDGESGKPTGRV